MNIHEYQAKQLLAQFGVPVSRGIPCTNADEAGKAFVALNEPLEISSLIGNISLKDGQPFVHAHVILSNARGKTWGGHLASGTIVFACEYTVEVFGGMEFTRLHDEGTGLHLWHGEDER